MRQSIREDGPLTCADRTADRKPTTTTSINTVTISSSVPFSTPIPNHHNNKNISNNNNNHNHNNSNSTSNSQIPAAANNQNKILHNISRNQQNQIQSQKTLPPQPLLQPQPQPESQSLPQPQQAQINSEIATTTTTTTTITTTDTNQSMTLEDLEIIKTIGTGTFGRVVLVLEKEKAEYSALKILALSDVIRLKQVDHVKNEKNILKQVNHPFIVNMKWHYKDEYNIYMLFDYVCGGELFSYLRSAGHFSSSTSSFYAAEIVSALEYLHARCIVYRDLKPENLLLDKEGHLKITDFGFAKKLNDRTWTLCGTPEYLAPEIIQSKGHNKAVDWWALGVLIYEMNCGFPPFFDDNNFSTYEKILAGKVEWPKNIDAVAKDLVKKLLAPDRTKRLGNMKNGAEDVKRHRWFKDYEWEDVFNRRLLPPIIPKVSFDGDTHNFDDYPEQESWRMKSVSETELELFADF